MIELRDGLFPPATWVGPRRPSQFGPVTAPYPGPRPVGSFMIRDGVVLGLRPTGDGSWTVRDSGERVDTVGRLLVLAYGSNLDPRKLAVRLATDSVVAFRCAVVNHAAVWCDARRGNGDVVATLVEVPGHIEVHGVLALTATQLRAMDAWEGAPVVYERRSFMGRVVLEDGTEPADVFAYVGTARHRPPLRRTGRPYLVAQTSYDAVDRLVKH